LIGSSITSLIWLRIMEIGDIRVSRSPASRGRWGTLRKASIARALTLHPDILLLDEPLIELDQASRTSVVALLDELKGGGTTLVITTHYPDEVQQVAGPELKPAVCAGLSRCCGGGEPSDLREDP
jgi:energy-coupling factor transporter ATP-binding protein EcfA2